MISKRLNRLGKNGGPPETRTPDPLIKSLVYGPTTTAQHHYTAVISRARHQISSRLDALAGHSPRTKGGQHKGIAKRAVLQPLSGTRSAFRADTQSAGPIEVAEQSSAF